MAGKPFRLRQVLEHARRQEEEKTLQLAALAEEQRRTRAALNALRDKEEAQLRAMQDIARAGAVDPGRLDAALTYLDALEGSIARQMETMAELESRVLESREELVAILKEKQLLERLEERHAEGERSAEARDETRQGDEISAQRFLRGRNEGAA